MIYFTLFLLFILVWLIVDLTYQYLKDQKLLKTVTKNNRGTKTERQMIIYLLKSGIPHQTIFHDLYLIKSNNHFCQIDIVVVTKVGIFVFEIKEYNGWIFGKPH